jgi:hypothetical protein
MDSDNKKIWGCRCRWHQNETWCHQIGAQGKGSKILWTLWQTLSTGQDTGWWTKTKIFGQIKAINLEVCGKNFYGYGKIG